MSFNNNNNNDGGTYNNRHNNNIILNDKYVNLKFFKKQELSDQERIFLKVQTFMNEGILPKCIGMGLGGGFLGILAGAFFFTMQPSNIDYNLGYKEQLKEQFYMFKQSIKNTCFNFAKIGFLFSFYENSLQKIRAANDVTNTLYSGCLTGATISRKKGIPKMLTGCASFAAFSAIVEKLQKSKTF
ncbi:mitochondrial import inner membrane translocase subunit TIM22, putative [Hepatocystis sp. ex Piliocolobus tephrosceles]|nr:mitochondrial import inner membrane translocase subunit TIM22, putative [Hepatocystis sp. ex Piliocolobus tephrosceles]